MPGCVPGPGEDYLQGKQVIPMNNAARKMMGLPEVEGETLDNFISRFINSFDEDTETSASLGDTE